MFAASLLSSALSFNSSAAGSQTKTPIKHIVIIMMENHSFDNIFGMYGRMGNGSIASNVTLPAGLVTGSVNSALTQVPAGNFTAANPVEGLSNYHVDWNNGTMNNFVNGSGPNSMVYYSSSQLALEWDLAQNYALADFYFSSVLSETLPNRLYSLAGFSPVTWDVHQPPPYVLYNQTIFGEMDAHGVTWSYYLQNPSVSNEPLNFIYGISGHSSNLRSWSDFESSLNTGTLPSVSWISPISGGASGYSQHPPDNVLAGQLWIFYLVHMIMQSASWNSTAIFITYDEGGGYYDNVSPPSLAGDQFGFRVPLIVISPYAKEDYVSNTVMSHASILAFIDYNWQMPALNELVSFSNLPLDMFDFTTPYPGGQIARQPLQLSSSLSGMLSPTLNGTLQYADNFSNISRLFPMPFQYSPTALPYNRSGEGNINLSQLGGQVLVTNDISYFPPLATSPSYFNFEILGGVGVTAGAMATFVLVRKRKK